MDVSERSKLETFRLTGSDDDGTTTTDELREVADDWAGKISTRYVLGITVFGSRTCATNACTGFHQDRSTTSAVVVEPFLNKHESGVAVLGGVTIICDKISLNCDTLRLAACLQLNQVIRIMQ